MSATCRSRLKPLLQRFLKLLLRKFPPLLLCSLLALAGCGPAPAPEATGPEAVARAVVAERLGLAASDVTVISVEARDFPDSSLGCPEPGMSYAQVITAGYRVLTEADGRRFDVRVAGEHGRICHVRKPARTTVSGKPQPRVSALVERAKQDLARRTGDVPEAITVTGLSPWKTGMKLPGCAPDCDGNDCGYHLRLHASSRIYDYRLSADGVQACPSIAAK
ncbi:MAG TPA: hypothetical protein ENK16_08560 [Chromatiales bacterium]|nr:hypothetical protein [Chromatiales bacterium]